LCLDHDIINNTDNPIKTHLWVSATESALINPHWLTISTWLDEPKSSEKWQKKKKNCYLACEQKQKYYAIKMKVVYV
jgi:hypothetical protein